jgi:hypothetical protein
MVAVGMPVTRHSAHRSVREELPHTAPTLSRKGQPLTRNKFDEPLEKDEVSGLHFSLITPSSAIIP